MTRSAFRLLCPRYSGLPTAATATDGRMDGYSAMGNLYMYLTFEDGGKRKC